MGLFRRKKDLTESGLPGTAVIRSEERAEFFDSDESTSLTDFGIGSYKFRFELDVTLDDGRPLYSVKGKFKVPAKFGGETGPGVTLPVYADPDDPTRIEINWDQFAATGGAEEFRAANEREREAHATESMVSAWVAAVKDGTLSPALFEQALATQVNEGTLTPERADAARQAIA